MSSISSQLQQHSLIAKFAARFGVDPTRLLATLKATCFRQKGKRNEQPPEITNEQMMALLIVADQYGLNPFTKELYAFPDGAGGIMPMVSVDGWIRIINAQSSMDGIEFIEAESLVDIDGTAGPEWIECVIYRRDRGRPTRIRERFAECYRPAGAYPDGNPKPKGPWQTHPYRFLRHRSLIQCARVAFGLSGIMVAEDDDTDDRVVEVQQQQAPTTIAQSLGGGAASKQPARIEQQTDLVTSAAVQGIREPEPMTADREERQAEARQRRPRQKPDPEPETPTPADRHGGNPESEGDASDFDFE